ncbi:MAG: MBL fold metallo-hydrolase [Dehalobacterium sp.]
MPVYAEKHWDKFCFTLEPTQVFSDVFVTGEIARQFDTKEITKGLFLDPEGKDVDFVIDDQSLIINTSKGLVVLLGCCHAGVANTLETVADFTGEKKFYMVLGGMHLSNASEDTMRETVQGLHKFHVQKIGLAHCTGHRGTEALTRLFSGEIFSCDVGDVIQLE